MSKNTNLIDDAILDIDKIQKLLKENTEEILRATMRGEINNVLKEDLSDDEYEEEDVDVDAMDTVTDTEADNDVDSLDVETPDGGLDIDVPDGEDAEIDLGADISDLGAEVDLGADEVGLDTEVGLEPEVMDLTGVSDDEVISVFKKLNDTDEIEIVSNNEVNIKDPESGNEYHVKMGGGSEVDDEPIYDVALDNEIDDEEMNLGGDEAGIDLDVDVDAGVGDELELDVDAADEDLSLDVDNETPDADVEIELDNKDEELGESVDIIEDIIRNAMGDRKMGTEKPAPNKGDIEGQKSSVDSDSGDNLDGGFEEDQTYAKGEASYIMEDDDELKDDELKDEDVVEEELRNQDGNERKNKYSTGRTAQPNGDEVRKGGIAEAHQKLIKEVKNLKTEREAFKKSLGKFKKVLAETVIYNNNLKNVTKLFTENSTNRKEKENIIERFDNVQSLTESENLYQTINIELTKKQPISESIMLNNEKAPATSKLNQKTAYVDQNAMRIIELMERVEGRKLI